MSTRGANWTPLIGDDGAVTGRGGRRRGRAKYFGCHFRPWGLIYKREGISCVTMAVAERKPSLVERLFADHRAALQAFFLRRIRSKADAADLAQEVYVRMLRISDQEAIRNPVHYLYTVANNLVKGATQLAADGRRLSK